MPKLRHIAIATNDPDATAEFYTKAFGFEVVGKSDGLLAKGYYLSDGTLNLAILKFNSDQLGKGMDFTGVHHFGVLVDDVEEASKKLEALGASYYMNRPTKGAQGSFEVKFHGPDGTLFDIAEHAWVGSEPLPEDAEQITAVAAE